MNFPFSFAALETAAETTEESFDFSAIKEAMEGFELETLLPQMSGIFAKVLLLCRIAILVGPILLLILGIAYLLIAPKEANYYFGYRTYFGMGSVQAWQFTQKVAGALMTLAGLILLIVMIVKAGAYPGMEINDMVWSAVRCLAWQAGTMIAVTLLANLAAALCYNRKGEPRRWSTDNAFFQKMLKIMKTRDA